MNAPAEITARRREPLRFRIEGMDCASCTAKIETALARMPGTSELSVSLVTETLSLVLDPAASTSRDDVASKIRTLGFGVSELPPIAPPGSLPLSSSNGETHHHGHAADAGHGHDHHHGACGHDHDHPHSHAAADATAGSPNLSMRIEGMDCASCSAKIETALARLPGVSDVRVNFTTETLGLTLATGASTGAEDIARTIRSLGFGVADVEGSTAQHRETGAVPSALAEAPPRWWQTRKGRLVIGLGALMLAAYALAQVLPGHAQWVFVLAVLAGVAPFARQALALATSGTPFSIEMLMSVAAIGALMIGAAEEAAAVVFLFALGELLESVAAGRARAGIRALAGLVPKTAVLVMPSGSQRVVAAADLAIDDMVLVRPGDRVPADGLIVEGTSSLDESPVTGESALRSKTLGESVFAGSINADGVLRIRVEKTAADNTIARIIQLVEQAQGSKAPTARFIERFSAYYTPAVMALAALTILLPPLLAGQPWDLWLYRGLALLLIACPCALVLSTPAAIASGLAAATRRGLLIKGGKALETIGHVDAICFDKTGTLTEGKPRVTDVACATPDMNEAQLLALAAAVESGSSHPLARAITARAAQDGLAIPAIGEASAVPGKAVRASVDGRRLAVGSPDYARASAELPADLAASIEALEGQGKTVVLLLDEDRPDPVLGLIAVRDEPREDAREGLARLSRLGIRSIMLTGDNRRTAQAIAGGLGIDWQAGLMPQDKLRIIDELKQKHRVAMVGDGINDAPALASAHVGIAMGGGTDVALETADAALLKNQVGDLAHLVALSRATMRNIRQNVVFALGLKGVFLVTSMLGITGLWIAVLADTGATAIVTLNALRLLRFRE